MHYKTQQTLHFRDKHLTSGGFTRARLGARLSAIQPLLIEISGLDQRASGQRVRRTDECATPVCLQLHSSVHFRTVGRTASDCAVLRGFYPRGTRARENT